jgi:hypothetical protein
LSPYNHVLEWLVGGQDADYAVGERWILIFEQTVMMPHEIQHVKELSWEGVHPREKHFSMHA